ncbi:MULTISPECIES: hypothetical protein [unclassified Streptomyces]|uniref:hypothetical protein n=1 Tax=unclassified Streptomyces TaxID=2593676 RepID=UPI00145E1785|nr:MULTISPECIES: hypothetical protein [unclassified Streptomyces]
MTLIMQIVGNYLTVDIENWNSANTVLHDGKDGALTGPDKEHAETSMLAPCTCSSPALCTC